MMKPLAALFTVLLAPIQVISFSPPNTGSAICRSRGVDSQSSTTSLYGTIRFVGNAKAAFNTPSIITTNDQDEDVSLSKFLLSSASDPVLLGTSEYRRMDGDGGEGGELWECRQGSVGWFGMTLVPIFINRIEKDPSSQNVVISIIDATTDIQDGGRIGSTLGKAMKRSEFEGRNAVAWKELNGGTDQSYALEGNLELTLTINLPRFLPLAPGFNTIGSKIVERTCKERLRQNLSDISDAYLVWATTPK